MHTLAVVSMFKNEGMIIEEWIQHHLECGVDHFYLIDNGSTDDSCAKLQPYIDKGQVGLVSDPRRFGRETLQVKQWNSVTDTCQTSAVNKSHTHQYLINEHYLERVKKEAEWVWVIDIDEYVFSTQQSLKNLVLTLPEDVTEVWTPWRIFGSSELQHQPNSIRKSFVHCMSFPRFRDRVTGHGRVRGHGKTCTRVSALRRLGIHQCELTRTLTLLPDGSTVRNKPELNEWFESWSPTKTDVAFCNHYMVMSEEYFSKCKAHRQGGAGRPNHPNALRRYWARNNANDVEDTLILSAVSHRD